MCRPALATPPNPSVASILREFTNAEQRGLDLDARFSSRLAPRYREGLPRPQWLAAS